MIKHFGALQDGGITDNNPTEKALWELVCIWPDHVWPHFVISVGTGHQKTLASDTGYRGTWSDGFAFRILRAFLSSPAMNAENSWTALSNRLPDDIKERFHRLTHEFADGLPELDDTLKIPQLIQQVSESHLDLDEEKRKLWASRFFFELESSPQRVRDYFICHGTILCRFRDSRSLLDAVSRYCDFPRIVVENKILTALLDESCVCKGCGYFRKPVTFEVPLLNHLVAMSLEFTPDKRSFLASFPKPMQWFVDRQWKNDCWIRWPATSPCCESQSKRKRLGPARNDTKRRRVQ